MNTHGVMERERERLALIQSDRDPALFQAMRAHVRGERTMNRTVIVNFADEDTRFGCRFKCHFCSWRKRATELGDIFPTMKNIDGFLAKFQGVVVTISGGGDPLYRLERNWKRLSKLVDWIHDHGMLAEVVTKETDEVRRILTETPRRLPIPTPGPADTVRRIDMYSLSYESSTEQCLEEVRAISMHRLVRVSKVCTPGFSERSFGHLGKYCSEMRAAGAYQVILREDANHIGILADTDKQALQIAIRQGAGSVRWLRNADCTNNFFLIGDEVHLGDIGLGSAVDG